MALDSSDKAPPAKGDPSTVAVEDVVVTAPPEKPAHPAPVPSDLPSHQARARVVLRSSALSLARNLPASGFRAFGCTAPRRAAPRLRRADDAARHQYVHHQGTGVAMGAPVAPQLVVGPPGVLVEQRVVGKRLRPEGACVAALCCLLACS
jgi:hypothetical protein